MFKIWLKFVLYSYRFVGTMEGSRSLPKELGMKHLIFVRTFNFQSLAFVRESPTSRRRNPTLAKIFEIRAAGATHHSPSCWRLLVSHLTLHYQQQTLKKIMFRTRVSNGCVDGVSVSEGMGWIESKGQVPFAKRMWRVACSRYSRWYLRGGFELFNSLCNQLLRLTKFNIFSFIFWRVLHCDTESFDW